MTDKTLWRVHYHGDGGQCCIGAHRDFLMPGKASNFAEIKRNEKGHYCQDSVRIEEISGGES